MDISNSQRHLTDQPFKLQIWDGEAYLSVAIWAPRHTLPTSLHPPPTFHCYHSKLYPKSQSTYIMYHWQIYFSVLFSLLTCSCLALGLFCKSRFNFPHLKITWAAYICFSSCLNWLLRELTMPLNWNAFTESLRTENFTLVENEGYEWLSLSFWSREAFYESWNIFTFPWLNRPSQIAIVSCVFLFCFPFV